MLPPSAQTLSLYSLFFLLHPTRVHPLARARSRARISLLPLVFFNPRWSSGSLSLSCSQTTSSSHYQPRFIVSPSVRPLRSFPTPFCFTLRTLSYHRHHPFLLCPSLSLFLFFLIHFRAPFPRLPVLSLAFSFYFCVLFVASLFIQSSSFSLYSRFFASLTHWLLSISAILAQPCTVRLYNSQSNHRDG